MCLGRERGEMGWSAWYHAWAMDQGGSIPSSCQWCLDFKASEAVCMLTGWETTPDWLSQATLFSKEYVLALANKKTVDEYVVEKENMKEKAPNAGTKKRKRWLVVSDLLISDCLVPGKCLVGLRFIRLDLGCIVGGFGTLHIADYWILLACMTFTWRKNDLYICGW
jgi:hypothetical protein